MKNKITTLLVCTTLVLSGIILIPNAFAENVPNWVKNTAGWWATDAISETEFVNAVEFLVKENIIQVNVMQTSETSQGVPDWVKNTAGWWAADAISETEFVNAIAYLIKVGIISIESSKSPELIAEMWVNGLINDDEFLRNVDDLIEKEIITIQSDSITNTSDLPDWLVNNAGWWAARIFTNSDFVFDPGYLKKELYPCEENSLERHCLEETYNSYGLRTPEFEKEKPDNTFRIFTLGGSTTWGAGASDDEIWSAHLQKIINEKITDKEVEVINAGTPGGTTKSEYGSIKNKLLSFDPDLIIMYDGWNDVPYPIDETFENWKSVCELGKNKGFDTLIIVQPLTTTGHRVLTEQEVVHSFSYVALSELEGVGSSYFSVIFPQPDIPAYLQKSQQYVDTFEELDEVCTKTADFRRIFDYVQEPIFYDAGHTMSFGNKIIAENVFSVISPIYFGQTYSVIHSNLNSENNKPGTGVVYAAGADLSGKNFDNLNLQSAIFDKANLSNTNFKNADINGARFAFANLAGADLSYQDLTGTILIGADLSHTNLAGTILKGADLSHTNLTGVDLSGKDLTGMMLTGADLSDANLAGADLSGTDLTYANLSGQDLSNHDLTDVILRGANLSNSVLPDNGLSGKNFKGTIFDGVDLSEKDLSKSNFEDSSLKNTNLKNANLAESYFLATDLTNANLAGANVMMVHFPHSNLTGVNLAGAILTDVNFFRANLPDVDLTVISNPYIRNSAFYEANLSNSNFEGIDLSPQFTYSTPFANRAYLENASVEVLRINLFGETDDGICVTSDSMPPSRCPQLIHIISTVVSGNDLVVENVFFNSFEDANLENANFKNALLMLVDFSSANLTNANLSGADLRKASLYSANLRGADLTGADLSATDLSGADLTGADLIGANYDASTILNCVGHPICKTG